MSFNFSRKMFGGMPDGFRLALVYQVGHVHQGWHPAEDALISLVPQSTRMAPLADAPKALPVEGKDGNQHLSGGSMITPGGSTVNVDWTSDDSEKDV
eukprot:scaffold100560_cov39-Prasinocladus_malaysianus.AAC.1